jgi:hypothetical protein
MIFAALTRIALAKTEVTGDKNVKAVLILVLV